MSKRLAVKLAVSVAALGAMTLLQGCGADEDGMVIGGVWAPVGFSAPAAPAFAPSTGNGGGGGGGGGGSTSQTASSSNG